MLHPLFRALRSAFPSAIGGAFAPGRVNLIGEHTDYSGLPVLPFAIGRGVAAAWGPRGDDVVLVCSSRPNRFPTETIKLGELESRPMRGNWVDYVVAGLRLHPPTRGCEVYVAGDLPDAVGLASSSALVCASALLFAPPDVERKALAERARVAEQYVGTLSGGMDQAVALLGRTGHALRIAFRPLRAEPVPVPPAMAVVVADSGVRAEKGGASQLGYNERVLQCLAAARALGCKQGQVLGDVPGGAEREAKARALKDKVLARRAGFVFAEAARVDEAVAALRAGDLPRLGALLDASHRGLVRDYEVGHRKVESLVTAAKAFGALGARIVGAGFGGCCIALTTTDRAEALAKSLRENGAIAAFSVAPSEGAVHGPV